VISLTPILRRCSAERSCAPDQFAGSSAQRRRWEPGTRLLVGDTPEGVLMKAAPVFAPTRPADVAGMLAYHGPPKTLEEMDAALTAEVARCRARGRY